MEFSNAWFFLNAKYYKCFFFFSAQAIILPEEDFTTIWDNKYNVFRWTGDYLYHLLGNFIAEVVARDVWIQNLILKYHKWMYHAHRSRIYKNRPHKWWWFSHIMWQTSVEMKMFGIK